MPDVEWNRRVWDETHGWDEGGDEWSGMAAHCHQPYEDWKAALVSELLTPQFGSESDVLEVAPGHGRFSASIAGKSRTLTLVDLSPTCLNVCRDRFSQLPGMRFIQTEGSTLPGVADSSIDFIWSFDSFVHMERPVIDGYLGEFARVLRPGGTFTIHHAGKRNWSLSLIPLTSRMGTLGRVVQRIISQGRLRDEGRRAQVSREVVADLVATHGMELLSQRQDWGSHGEFDVTKYRDVITSGRKPKK